MVVAARARCHSGAGDSYAATPTPQCRGQLGVVVATGRPTSHCPQPMATTPKELAPLGPIDSRGFVGSRRGPAGHHRANHFRTAHGVHRRHLGVDDGPRRERFAVRRNAVDGETTREQATEQFACQRGYQRRRGEAEHELRPFGIRANHQRAASQHRREPVGPSDPAREGSPNRRVRHAFRSGLRRWPV